MSLSSVMQAMATGAVTAVAHSARQPSPESVDTMLADVEKTMAANARMLARAGHLNRKDSPGIRHGKALMMRAKKEAELNTNDDPDSRVGLGSLGMKAAVLEHFRRMSQPDVDYRLALQRQEVMREQGTEITGSQA